MVYLMVLCKYLGQAKSTTIKLLPQLWPVVFVGINDILPWDSSILRFLIDPLTIYDLTQVNSLHNPAHVVPFHNISHLLT